MTLFIILVALAIFATRHSSTFWFVALPGTIVHESLHWIIGKLLGARPYDFNVVPSYGHDHVTYGSVSFENFNTFNAAPTALAPLLGIPLALLAWPFVQGIEDFWGKLFAIWCLAAVLAQSLPSQADWAVALRHPVGLVCWAGAGAYFLL